MFYIIVYAVFLIIIWWTVVLSIVRKKKNAPLGIAEYSQLIVLVLISGVLMLYSGTGRIGLSSAESFVLWAGLSLLIIILHIVNTLLHFFFRSRNSDTIPSAFFPSALLMTTGIMNEYILLLILTVFYFIISLWSDKRKRSKS